MAGVLLGDCIGVDYISFTEASSTSSPSSYPAISLKVPVMLLAPYFG
jgi:hypothetical protein